MELRRVFQPSQKDTATAARFNMQFQSVRSITQHIHDIKTIPVNGERQEFTELKPIPGTQFALPDISRTDGIVTNRPVTKGGESS